MGFGKLLVFGILPLAGLLGSGFTAPLPKEPPMFKCELRFTGMVGKKPFSDGGEVEVTNISTVLIDIGTRVGPQGSLDFMVIDPNGKSVKTGRFGNMFSPFEEIQPYPLKSGETYRDQMRLLVMVPEEKRIPGTYKVKAVFTFKKKDYESAEVEVKWPGNKK